VKDGWDDNGLQIMQKCLEGKYLTNYMIISLFFFFVNVIISTFANFSV
jgi:hypothetical protein